MSTILAIWDQDNSNVTPQTLESLVARPLTHAVAAHVGLGAVVHRNDHAPIIQRQDLLLVVDARIDNRLELSEQLELEAGCSDADLIAAAWDRWKTECAAHLIGDFAFVLWAPESRTLYAARDCMGARLLHYVRREHCLILATEADQVAAHDAVSDSLSRNALCMWALGLYDEGLPLFSAVECLPAGHALIHTPDRFHVQPYWSFGNIGSIRYGSEQEYLEHFRHLLACCVADRCQTSSDKALIVGSMLSGGMDSTSVTAMAASHIKAEELIPFSFRFKTLADCDESRYSTAVAQKLDLDIEWVDSEDFWLFKEAFDDETIRHDPFQCWDRMDHHILERLAARGGTLLLTGHGGDSLMTGLGLPTILGARVLSGRLSAFPQLVRELRRLKRPLASGLADYLLGPLLPGSLKHRLKRGMGRLPSLPSWLTAEGTAGSEAVTLQLGSFPRLFRRPDQQFAWQQMMPISMGIRRVIHYYNRISPEYGINVRHPLYDRRLAEFMLAIPQEMVRLGGRQKGFLRAAMTGILPDLVVNRMDKPDLASFYHYGIHKEQESIRTLIADARLARLGLMNAKQLEQTVNQYLVEDPAHATAGFWAAVMTELWLQSR